MKDSLRGAYNLLHDGSLALAQMEATGIGVDVAYLDNAIKSLDGRIGKLEASLREDKVFKLWEGKYRGKTKLSAPEQLANVIFKTMGYECKDLTPTGKPKANESSFTDVDLPFIKNYFDWKKAVKARDNTLAGIRRETIDGRLHPTFNLHTTVSFRSSSGADKDNTNSTREVNFQNLPIRNKFLGEIIRKSIIPSKGNYLAEPDFSGIEVKMACCYTKDPKLIDDFTTPGKDPHRNTAAQLFMLSTDQLDRMDKKGPRDWAKNRFVFPQFFGSVYFQCAPHIWEVVKLGKHFLPDGKTSVLAHLQSKGIKELGDCDPKARAKPGTFVHHVKLVEESFWAERFHVYTDWKNRWYKNYLAKGEFYSYTGFRFRGNYKRNQVLNYPIQSSAFHCLLWSIIEITKYLRKHRMKTRLVGQIHDSILADCPPNELSDFLSIAKEIMTVRLPREWDWINVPLGTESEVSSPGTSWYDKKEYSEQGGVWMEVNKK